jgi:hypothetical protein
MSGQPLIKESLRGFFLRLRKLIHRLLRNRYKRDQSSDNYTIY